MENARVVVIEDDEIVRKVLVRRLEAYGHSVLHQAITIEEARELIADLHPDDRIDVVITDANLARNRRDNADGAEIVRLTREKLPDTAIYEFSGSGSLKGTTASFRKPDLQGLLAAIKNLPERV